MKITQTIALVSVVILAAGCAHEEHQAQYDESAAPNGNSSSQYNQYNNNQYGSYQNDNTARAGSDSDGVLAGQVRQSLQQDAQIAPLVPNIQISAHDGTVNLSGSVQSDEQKQRIEAIVHSAAGVVTVRDHLQVSGSTMNPTSRPNAGSSIYSNGNGKINEQEGNQPANSTANGGDNSVNNAAPSDVNNSTNSLPRIYHDSAGSMNAATNNVLSPTSRTNGESQIYQENQPQNPQVNTNGNNKIP